MSTEMAVEVGEATISPSLISSIWKPYPTYKDSNNFKIAFFRLYKF